MIKENRLPMRTIIAIGMVLLVILALIWAGPRLAPNFQSLLQQVGLGAAPTPAAEVKVQLPVDPPLPPIGDGQGPGLLSLDEAQQRVNFTIRLPEQLPSGYSFRGVMPIPEPAGNTMLPLAEGEGVPSLPNLPQFPTPDATASEQPQMVFLIFANDAGQQITLVQSQTIRDRGQELRPPPQSEPGYVEAVTVNNQAGYYVKGRWTRSGWIDDGSHRLYWQTAEGMRYDLNSQAVERDALMAIATSIK